MATKTSVLTIEQNIKLKLVDFTCDGAYAAGGYAFTPASIGLTEIYGVELIGNHPGILVNYAAGKLKIHGSGAASAGAFTELAANSAVIGTGTVLRLLVIGH